MELVYQEIIVVTSTGGLPSALQLLGHGPEGSEGSGEPSPTYGRFDLEGKRGTLNLHAGSPDVLIAGIPPLSTWNSLTGES